MEDKTLINCEATTEKHVPSHNCRKCRLVSCYIVKHVLSRLPILSWLPNYSLEKLQCDIIAGVTVGLMVIPQALAYASIARLPNQYGLYSSFMGCFVYTVFGTSKDITIGPTAILSLLVSTYSIQHGCDMAILLSFCVGFILLTMGVFQLGFLVRFVSVPVISAFTSASAITIACGQIKDLNGIFHSPRDFIGNLETMFKNVKNWNFYDLGYGLMCIVILLLMRLLTKIKWNRPGLACGKSSVYKIIWFCGIGRNALLVLISCIIVYILSLNSSQQYLTSVGNITGGLPPFRAPKFTFILNNKTFTFKDSLEHFGSGLIVTPLIAFLETIAIAKAFSRLNNYKILPSQELIALGLANILGSFVSAFPVTGSFSRTAVNSQSGVKTPLAGLFTGALVLIATQFLAPFFHYIPKACLGAIIISAVLPVTDFPLIKTLWNVKKIDLLPYIGTFVGCFYSIEVGLGFGLLISLSIILYHVSNPQIEATYRDVTVIKLQNGIMYPGVQNIVAKIEEVIASDGHGGYPPPPSAIIVDFNGIHYIDYTVVTEMEGVFEELMTKLPATDIFITNVKLSVKRVLVNTEIKNLIKPIEEIDEMYGSIHEAYSEIRP